MEFTRESFLKIAQNNGFSFDGFDSLLYNEEVFEKKASLGNWVAPMAVMGGITGAANRPRGEGLLDSAQTGLLEGAASGLAGFGASKFGKNHLNKLIFGGLGMAGLSKLKQMIGWGSNRDNSAYFRGDLVDILENRENQGFGAPIGYNPMDFGGVY